MIKIVWKCINIIAISPKRGMEQAEIIDTFWTYRASRGGRREATPITMAAKSIPPDRGCVRQIGMAKAANPPRLLEEVVAVDGGDGGRRRPSPPGSRAWGCGEGRGICSRDLVAR